MFISLQRLQHWYAWCVPELLFSHHCRQRSATSPAWKMCHIVRYFKILQPKNIIMRRMRPNLSRVWWYLNPLHHLWCWWLSLLFQKPMPEKLPWWLTWRLVTEYVRFLWKQLSNLWQYSEHLHILQLKRQSSLFLSWQLPWLLHP